MAASVTGSIFRPSNYSALEVHTFAQAYSAPQSVAHAYLAPPHCPLDDTKIPPASTQKPYQAKTPELMPRLPKPRNKLFEEDSGLGLVYHIPYS